MMWSATGRSGTSLPKWPRQAPEWLRRRLIGFFASERGYPTPKIDVRAAVIVDDRILLVQERDDECWAMPGGWADIGESAAEAVVRETREEAGVDVRAVKLSPTSESAAATLSIRNSATRRSSAAIYADRHNLPPDRRQAVRLSSIASNCRGCRFRA